MRKRTDGGQEWRHLFPQSPNAMSMRRTCTVAASRFVRQAIIITTNNQSSIPTNCTHQHGNMHTQRSTPKNATRTMAPFAGELRNLLLRQVGQVEVHENRCVQFCVYAAQKTVSKRPTSRQCREQPTLRSGQVSFKPCQSIS